MEARARPTKDEKEKERRREFGEQVGKKRKGRRVTRMVRANVHRKRRD